MPPGVCSSPGAALCVLQDAFTRLTLLLRAGGPFSGQGGCGLGVPFSGWGGG